MTKNELKKKIIENMVVLPSGMKVVNLTSINLFFDDGFVVPKGNKELLTELLPIAVTVEKKIAGNVTIEVISYQGAEPFDDEDFMNFIEDENVYFIGSHITCSTYRHPRVIMTKIVYKENGKKLGIANQFTTIK